MPNQRYRFRYSVEPWDKPVPTEDVGERAAPGVRASNSNYGYTDRLFVVSFVEDEDGSESVLMLDSKDGPKLSREILETVRDQIDHYLDEHCE